MLSATGLRYEVRGNGEPVLLIHGSHIADTYLSFVKETALGHFRLVTYQRRGFAASVHHTGALSVEEQARDALDILRTLGIARAHIVGHSYGGVIALQLVLAAPSAVHSLVLLEPALTMVPSAPALSEAIAPAVDKYAAGDAAGAVHLFISVVAGPNWRTEIPRMVPGGVEQAEKDASTFFDVELPALNKWAFDAHLASQISQPVLYVIGSASGPFFEDGKKLCQAWFPQTEEFIVAGATHLLQYQNSRCSAEVAWSFGNGSPRTRRDRRKTSSTGGCLLCEYLFAGLMRFQKTA